MAIKKLPPGPAPRGEPVYVRETPLPEGTHKIVNRPNVPTAAREAPEALGDALNATGDRAPGAGFEAHHIVTVKAGPDWLRQRMYEAGIRINDPRNGVWLPKTAKVANEYARTIHLNHVHAEHSTPYLSALEERLADKHGAAFRAELAEGRFHFGAVGTAAVREPGETATLAKQGGAKPEGTGSKGGAAGKRGTAAATAPPVEEPHVPTLVTPKVTSPSAAPRLETGEAPTKAVPPAGVDTSPPSVRSQEQGLTSPKSAVAKGAPESPAAVKPVAPHARAAANAINLRGVAKGYAKGAAGMALLFGLGWIRGQLDNEVIKSQIEGLKPYVENLLKASLPKGMEYALREPDEGVYATVIYRISQSSTARTEVDPPFKDLPAVDVRVVYGLEPKDGELGQGKANFGGVAKFEWTEVGYSVLLDELIEHYLGSEAHIRFATERGSRRSERNLDPPRHVTSVPQEDPIRPPQARRSD